MPRRGTPDARGYGAAYRQARKKILEGDPLCWWGCGRPATTADHVPSIEEAGGPHLSLVPACGPCNYGRRHRRRPPAPSRAW